MHGDVAREGRDSKTSDEKADISDQARCQRQACSCDKAAVVPDFKTRSAVKLETFLD
jgi:hypothetical protein